MTVPLDRSGAVPGAINLSVERRAATGGQSHTAVLALAGGPGQAALPYAHDIAEAIAPALSGRDLLLFDQRGTGSSDPLSCPALTTQEAAAESGEAELAARCASQLGAARGAYTTSESVEDIEAVRRAAGYEKLVLYGTSYGTKVALEYAQRYPEHVEAIVLDSTETPEGPEPFHVATFQAIRPALAELCSHGACASASEAPLSDLAHLVASASSRPLVGVAYTGTGHRVSVPVTTRELFALLMAGDINPELRAELPAAVHSAVRGDLAPLASMLAIASLHPTGEQSSEQIDETLLIDTTCEETPFPWRREAPETVRAIEAEAALNALPRSDFYPFDSETALLDQTIPLCIGWPDASAPPQVGAGLPDVPTLILSGGQDLRTPTADARRVASMIPDAQLLTVPYTGHSVIGSDLSGCAAAALQAFFAGARVQQCRSAANPFPPSPEAPRSASSLRPTGPSGRDGRTVTAAIGSLRSLRDSVLDIALDFGELPADVHFGGLRGGTAAVTKAEIVLHRFSYVPGVQLSGTVPMALLLKAQGPAASLSVGGQAAAHGSLLVDAQGHIDGRLDGRRVALAVGARAAAVRVQGGAQAGPLGGAVSLPRTRLAWLP